MIGIRYQMGFSLESELDKHLPNATKCLTWQDVKQSHTTKDHKVVVQLEDTYGMMILLTGGIIGSVMIMILELLSKDQNNLSTPRQVLSTKYLLIL